MTSCAKFDIFRFYARDRYLLYSFHSYKYLYLLLTIKVFLNFIRYHCVNDQCHLLLSARGKKETDGVSVMQQRFETKKWTATDYCMCVYYTYIYEYSLIWTRKLCNFNCCHGELDRLAIPAPISVINTDGAVNPQLLWKLTRKYRYVCCTLEVLIILAMPLSPTLIFTCIKILPKYNDVSYKSHIQVKFNDVFENSMLICHFLENLKWLVQCKCLTSKGGLKIMCNYNHHDKHNQQNCSSFRLSI